MVVTVPTEKNTEDSCPEQHDSNHIGKAHHITEDDVDDIIDGPALDDQELAAVGTPQDSEVCFDTGDKILTIRKSGATAVWAKDVAYLKESIENF